MKTFEEIKEELLRRAKEAGACTDGYRMGLGAKCKQDLLKAITENWCHNRELVLGTCICKDNRCGISERQLYGRRAE